MTNSPFNMLCGYFNTMDIEQLRRARAVVFFDQIPTALLAKAFGVVVEITRHTVDDSFHTTPTAS